jgi:predicted house-cleaning noncanonical NTP pyrophosphatase (MazG superfamily)/SAM-dependent methyltransferase
MPEYNKLVRGRIPEIIEAHGEIPVTRVLNDNEYEHALIEKFAEEQKELADADTTEKIMEELADLQQLVWDTAEHIDSIERLNTITAQKAAERGSFAARIFLERTIESNELRQYTVNIYNESADKFAEYFKGIGPRQVHIKQALELAGNPKNPAVLELGCGDGRDAQVITDYTDNYKGIDISEGMVNLARKSLPTANFEVSDAVSYDFPDNLDVIYAFASLLHLDINEVKLVFEKAYKALRPGGVFYVSTKHRPEYTSEIKTDQFGKRLFYFYNAPIFTEMAGDSFEIVKNEVEHKNDTDWLEIAFRKK